MIGKPRAIKTIEQCEKMSVMNYQEKPQNFLKIYVQHPKFVAQLRTLIEKGIRIVTSHSHDCLSEVTYESNVLYALRFMIDNEIGGMTWVKIEKKNWEMRPN